MCVSPSAHSGGAAAPLRALSLQAPRRRNRIRRGSDWDKGPPGEGREMSRKVTAALLSTGSAASPSLAAAEFKLITAENTELPSGLQKQG